MSKRAKKAASAAYPFVKRKFVHPYGVTVFDGNYDRRETFQEGYSQAEKDLALTPEDVVVITTLYDCGKTRGWTIEEVLKRFNEQRKK